MIGLAIAGVVVLLLIAGAIAEGRRRRGAGFGYIAPRDLIKYK